VSVVSAVSGGSIAAAKLAAEWATLARDGFSVEAFCEAVFDPMRKAVAATNIRNAWLRRTATGRGIGRGGRGLVLGEVLRERLDLPPLLADLPSEPQVIFTSTCLNTGRAFRFARDFCGSWDYGYCEPAPQALRLGTALAASAAFPLTLTAVRLGRDQLSLPREAPSTITLVDGGVYDNLGLEWFQGSDSGRPATARSTDLVLVINASGVLAPASRRFGAIRLLLRDLSVQYAQTLNVRVRWFVDQLMQNPGAGLYVGINRDPRGYTLADSTTPIDPGFYDGALPSTLADLMPRVRTDLDRFTPTETALLAYHGYWSLHARLMTFRPDLATAKPRWREFHDLSADQVQQFRLLLHDSGRARLFRNSGHLSR
jgi:NTE family protein